MRLEDLRQAAIKVTAANKGKGIWGFTFEREMWAPIMWSNGGDVWNEDLTKSTFGDKIAVDAVQWWGDLRNVDQVAPAPAQIAVVIVLLDIRREPDERDERLVAWLAHYNVPACYVLTKADKLKRGETARALQSITKKLGFAEAPLLTSVKSGQGIVELKLRDGRELRHHTREVRGTAANPMNRDEVAEKCVPLLATVIGKRRAEQLVTNVWRLEKLGNVRALRPLLAA